jgi:predicted nicotinamide N-methyase
MTELHQQTLVELAQPAPASGHAGLDGLRQVPVHLVPEIRLHLADDALVLWARMEAELGTTLAAPFWASAWLGGQALARFVLDYPETVAGRRVLDLAAGSGLVAIAASLAGAASVTANDIDPYANAAIEMNARANAVQITVTAHNMLDGDDTDDADVVLAGDVFYSGAMAQAFLPFLERASARGSGPGRGSRPRRPARWPHEDRRHLCGGERRSARGRRNRAGPRPAADVRGHLTGGCSAARRRPRSGAGGPGPPAGRGGPRSR